MTESKYLAGWAMGQEIELTTKYQEVIFQTNGNILQFECGSDCTGMSDNYNYGVHSE